MSSLFTYDFNKLIKSLGYAVAGLVQCFKREQNFRFELLASIFVIVLGFALKASNVEWLWLMFSICLVLSTEIMNTAIERLTDLVSDKRRTGLAGQAKDLAAGAVLISVLHSLVAGSVIFVPKIIKLF